MGRAFESAIIETEQIVMLWLAALLGAAFVALHAVPSSAQTICGEHAKFVDMLGVTYAEKAVAMGLTSTGAVIEVLTSPTGNWTILLTYPSGLTCMVAAGNKWEALPRPMAGELS